MRGEWEPSPRHSLCTSAQGGTPTGIQEEPQPWFMSSSTTAHGHSHSRRCRHKLAEPGVPLAPATCQKCAGLHFREGVNSSCSPLRPVGADSSGSILITQCHECLWARGMEGTWPSVCWVNSQERLSRGCECRVIFTPWISRCCALSGRRHPLLWAAPWG